MFYTSTDLAWLEEVNKGAFMEKEGDVWKKKDLKMGTTQWSTVIKHPMNDEWCIEVNSDWCIDSPKKSKFMESIPDLATKAKGPFTREEMKAAGWF